MSNSSLVTYTNLTKNMTKNRNSTVDNITIHCFVGQVTAKEGCDYFASTTRQVSANYVVGKDGSIGLSVDEKNRAWTTGYSDKNGNPIRVNGISGADNDHRAITIEVACDTKSPYAVTDKAYKALIELVADICKRNNMGELRWKGDKSLVGNVSKQNMTVHQWFAPTECPGTWLYSRMGEIATKANEIIKATSNTTAKPSEPTTEQSTTTKGAIHRVQVGAYSKEANATNQLKTVKKAGFNDAFILKEGNLHKVQVGAFGSKANAERFLKEVKQAGFKDAFISIKVMK